MKKVAFTFFVFVLISSCKTKVEKVSKDSESEISKEAVESLSPILEIGCYMYEDNGNKISLEITDISNTVLGNLDYALKDKDALSFSSSMPLDKTD